MTARTESSAEPGDAGPVPPLASVLRTEELERRPRRAPDHETENRALARLVAALAESPRSMLQTLADTMLETLRADTAGVSLLAINGDDRRFWWPAIAGAWKPHIGGGTPREFGPCGDVLDCDAPLLFCHPERRYRYLMQAQPAAVEALLLPFHIDGKAVGTIWAIAHDERRRFDNEDLRQLRSLGRFASAAYRVTHGGSAEDARRAALNLEDAVQARDATDKLVVELRDSEQRFRMLADNIPQLTWVAEPGTQGQATWFNKAWLDYTGTTLEQNQGSGWKAVHHPDHVQAVARKFEHHVQQCLDWEDTFPLRGKDGRFRWFLSRMKVLRDEAGQVSRLFGTNTDITEQRDMAEELRRAAAELSEVDRRKDEFLATLAHELRNPLAPIRNALAIIRRSGNGKACEAASEMMERQVNQMVHLVDDLLDVSRISRGRIELQRAPVELAAIVQQALEVARPACEVKRIELALALAPDMLRLDADSTRLIQVLGNLLNNACKFTHAGGRVQISIERDGGEAVIKVRDNGIGIAAEALPRIFDMFMQVDTSIERSASGLGIGLSLVKELVELHGGTVRASSEGAGRGSEFELRLPLAAGVVAVADAAPPPGRDEPSTTPQRRILVVDDNRDAAESLSELLRLSGHRTWLAHDGLDAVRAAAEFRPELVLLDIGLPKLNGYEAARRIREQPWGKDMVLVALTGWGQHEDRQKSSQAGFDEHLVKPLDFDALSSLLKGLPAAGR